MLATKYWKRVEKCATLFKNSICELSTTNDKDSEKQRKEGINNLNGKELPLGGKRNNNLEKDNISINLVNNLFEENSRNAYNLATFQLFKNYKKNEKMKMKETFDILNQLPRIVEPNVYLKFVEYFQEVRSLLNNPNYTISDKSFRSFLNKIQDVIPNKGMKDYILMRIGSMDISVFDESDMYLSYDRALEQMFDSNQFNLDKQILMQAAPQNIPHPNFVFDHSTSIDPNTPQTSNIINSDFSYFSDPLKGATIQPRKHFRIVSDIHIDRAVLFQKKGFGKGLNKTNIVLVKSPIFKESKKTHKITQGKGIFEFNYEYLGLNDLTKAESKKGISTIQSSEEITKSILNEYFTQYYGKPKEITSLTRDLRELAKVLQKAMKIREKIENTIVLEDLYKELFYAEFGFGNGSRFPAIQSMQEKYFQYIKKLLNIKSEDVLKETDGKKDDSQVILNMAEDILLDYKQMVNPGECFKQLELENASINSAKNIDLPQLGELFFIEFEQYEDKAKLLSSAAYVFGVSLGGNRYLRFGDADFCTSFVLYQDLEKCALQEMADKINLKVKNRELTCFVPKYSKEFQDWNLSGLTVKNYPLNIKVTFNTFTQMLDAYFQLRDSEIIFPFFEQHIYFAGNYLLASERNYHQIYKNYSPRHLPSSYYSQQINNNI